jgi:hypothetical protein
MSIRPKIHLKIRSDVRLEIDTKTVSNPLKQLTNAIYTPDDFKTLANTLLNQTILVANQKRYRLCEIEFYFTNPTHNDPYTHCRDEQSKTGLFYFHRYQTGTYKSGTYKGVDLTLGHPGTYFSVLIRSIMDLSTTVLTEGPCRSVNLLLEQFGCHTVAEFADGKHVPLSFYDQQYGLYIVHDSMLPAYPLSSGARIGLSQRSDDITDYRTKSYRFAIMAERIKKGRLYPLGA